MPKGIVLLAAAALLLAAAPARAVRVATWNMLAYHPLTITSARQANFRTVIAGLNPDILIAQEVNHTAAADSMRDNVLNVVFPGEFSGQWVDVGAGEGMAIFWRTSQFAMSNFGAFSDGGPRKVMNCLVKPTGYLTNPGWFRLYSFHLKAGGPGTADSTTRRVECTAIRDVLNNVFQGVVGPNFLIGGDSNFYGANEGGYIRLTESQADNDSGYLLWHTQSPCALPSGCIGSNGGLDDRFDLLLTSYGVQDGLGLDLANYITYGNDGQHFNTDINGSGFNNAVGYTIATALHDVSDHIPVVAVLRLPSKL
jgi:hypothetical protein